ncbi:MAG: hypothetical protein LQ351_006832 [Letrouitia transgressa]|nr:MAG: hypothetical protein LQ351_006832 [Letrouitia transgressa]
MLLRRSALALSRVTARAVPPPTAAARPFATSLIHHSENKAAPPTSSTPKKVEALPGRPDTFVVPLEAVETPDDLLPPGALPGTIPTDLEQSTGLERLEILGKMQGIDVFDMRPLDASRKGTLEDPIMVNSFSDEQIIGCTGYPADSHATMWCVVRHWRGPKSFADYVRPEYWGFPEGYKPPVIADPWGDYEKEMEAKGEVVEEVDGAPIGWERQ